MSMLGNQDNSSDDAVEQARIANTPTQPDVQPSVNHFAALLAAVEKLNSTMEGVKSTLIDHGRKFDILTKDALKNDQPYDEKALDDESTCTALYDIVMSKTKEKVEEWNGTIDVTLIFIALFSAVLTAFLVPASQALTPSPSSASTPGNSTSTSASQDPPPLPARSDEAVCALYYLSLITAIIVAVLSVLGRQWVRKLTIRPDVKSWKARTLWHVERMRRAEIWIKALMETVYWSLLLSIGLFITGLLYQLWNLSTSFERKANILLATWGLGIILSSGILMTMVATTYHAVRYQGSVFEGLLSRTVVDIGRRLSKGGPKETEQPENPSSSPAGVLQRSRDWALVKILSTLRRCRKPAHGLNLKVLQQVRLQVPKAVTNLWLCAPRLARRIKSLSLKKASSKFRNWAGALQSRVECDSMDGLLDTYLGLIGEASDPALLERAVASFSLSTWVRHGSGSTDHLLQSYTRLMATDTSVRVRETLNIQLSRFVPWLHERRAQLVVQKRERVNRWKGVSRQRVPNYQEWVQKFEAQIKEEDEEERRMLEVAKFYLLQPRHGIYRHIIASKENYANVLDSLLLPLEEFMAKALCELDQNRRLGLGNAEDMVYSALSHCHTLLYDKDPEKENIVRRILSHVDLFSLLRSICEGDFFKLETSFCDLVISGRKIEALLFLLEFVQEDHDWSRNDSHDLSVLFVAIAGSGYDIPANIDLSPIISHISRHPAHSCWRQTSNIAVNYLTQYHDIATLDDVSSILHFLQLCLDPYPTDQERFHASPETRDKAALLLSRYRTLHESHSSSADVELMPTDDPTQPVEGPPSSAPHARPDSQIPVDRVPSATEGLIRQADQSSSVHIEMEDFSPPRP
ncbi:hypothetical protein SISSUDRAFT_1127988 [Sistotremastrum suecicum HHB10207 ss-3]|uniref:DUF6535 domain-containing protein n=1 Tax=Sistotremastrum suecicum HHB10207 ss-3 TaxID=1314776 RepID=A0A166EDX2_9AGAM|nr:hypothetical protein SISSUDRAFT_1127988 [Sistotremastrum suecicum HHB10207 ss-3]